LFPEALSRFLFCPLRLLLLSELVHPGGKAHPIPHLIARPKRIARSPSDRFRKRTAQHTSNRPNDIQYADDSCGRSVCVDARCPLPVVSRGRVGHPLSKRSLTGRVHHQILQFNGESRDLYRLHYRLNGQPVYFIRFDLRAHERRIRAALEQTWNQARTFESKNIRLGSRKLHLADHSSEPRPRRALRDGNPLLRPDFVSRPSSRTRAGSAKCDGPDWGPLHMVQSTHQWYNDGGRLLKTHSTPRLNAHTQEQGI
jgi:hypothetical protein